MSIELPPLPSWSVEGEKITDDGRYVPLYDGDDVENRDAVREARERILLARVAELEANAERYRWLRDNSPGQWTLQVGYLPLFKGDLDAAIDAARGTK
jgi:hypothetical protein